MVCYARPAFRMAALLLVIFVAFGRPAGHLLASTALIVGIAMAVGGAALAAAIAFAVFLSVRRRRAAAGGCVSCQLRCQHAMTEPRRRLLLVSMVDRDAARPAVPAAVRPAAPAVPAVPAPVRPAAVRWPDRPAIRSGVALRPAMPAGRQRVRSVVLAHSTSALMLAGGRQLMSNSLPSGSLSATA